MTDRVVDAGLFVAEGALVDWGRVIAAQRGFTRHSNRRGQRFESELGGELQLRWHVSEDAGVPRVPFTVWLRTGRDDPQRADVSSFTRGTDTILTWDRTQMATVVVTCEPVDPARPCALWGFRRAGGLTSAVAVSTVATGTGPHTLEIRAGSITYARLTNARARSVRVVAAADVVASDEWRPFEIVGLPYDADAWSSTNYEGKEQGLVDAPTDPFDAAVQRLERAAPRAGWWPATESGHPVPPWDSPAPDQLVEEIRTALLAHVEHLFQPSQVPALQRDLRVAQVADPPTQDGRVAVVTTSRVTLPPFGALVVPATTDPLVSLGTGFGTGYGLGGPDEIGPHVDWMVTATYPEGISGRAGSEEYAWFVPWPDAVFHMTPPGSLSAARAGLTAPAVRGDPWRETVSLEWDALPRSMLFGRAVGAAALVFDPSTTVEATALLERHDSGGWRPLVPQPRLDPHGDRVAVNDRARELPRDGSDLLSGYAVAQQDPFGVWSSWEDVFHSTAEPNQPIPVISEFTALSRYVGTANCPTDVVVVITIDWTSRAPAFVQVPLVMWSAAFVGAPDPAGLSPFGPVPAGGRRVDLTMRFVGDVPDSLVAGLAIDCLAPDRDDVVAAGADQGLGSRRYRLSYSALTLDFGATAQWGLAAWARELVGGRPAWGATSPLPSHTFSSSPVPIIVPAVPLPIVPLGSLPDSEGRSHVALRLTGLPGAAKLVVWSAGEVRVRDAADFGPIPPNLSLSERFVELKSAFTSLSSALKQEVFSRDEELDAGPATEHDVALARGSREITLFAVTAVTPANIESPWPTDIDQLQAAAAPTLVTPGIPELSAAFVETPAGARIELSMATQSSLEVVAFEVHRTFIGEATVSSGTMGPPLPSVAASHVAGAQTPAGDRYEATVVDPSLGDWRAAYFRVVAVPTLGTSDRERGVVTRRSADSMVASLLLPPPDPPILEPVDVEQWGPTGTGVRIRVRTDAPVGRHPLGPFTLAGTASLTDGSPVVAVVEDIEDVPGGSSTTPPTDAHLGGISRDATSGSQTVFAVWFQRSAITDEVHCRFTLTDPLGRRRDLDVVVPPGTVAPPPTVRITSVVRSGAAVVVLFDTDAPDASTPAGPYLLGVRVSSMFRGGTASLQKPLADVPDAEDLGPNPTGKLVVARRRLGREVDYGALVRLRTPFHISISVTDPTGRTGSTDRRVNFPPFG